MKTMQRVPLTFPDGSAAAVVYLKAHLPGSIKIGRDLRGWTRPQAAVRVNQVEARNDGIINVVRLRVEIRAETFDEMHDLASMVGDHLSMMRVRDPGVAWSDEWFGARTVPDEDGREMIVMAFDIGFRATN